MLEINSQSSVEDAVNAYLSAICDDCIVPEIINTENALSRITFEDIIVQADEPVYDKALVDGYAVKSTDIVYAAEDSPIILSLAGEIDTESTDKAVLFDKQAMKIAKGAFMPENADAVLLPEYVSLKNNNIKVKTSVISDYNVTKRGEDLRAGDVFIRKSRKLRPQDIGGIIGIGNKQVKVYKKPIVTIIPTGNELVPIDAEPAINQIFSSNGYVLKGFVEQLGGHAQITPIVKDELNLVKNAIAKAAEVSDLVLVSGGSSTGARDYTLKAIEGVKNSKIIAHGIAMRPGAHVLLALINNKPVIGLPGHPVSNMTCFNVFGKPVLMKLAGTPGSFWQEKKETIKLDAFLAKNIKSPEGKEDYVRVRLLEEKDGKILAYPYTGKSSFLSTLVKSHGVIRIPAECTGLYEGDRVEVLML